MSWSSDRRGTTASSNDEQTEDSFEDGDVLNSFEHSSDRSDHDQLQNISFLYLGINPEIELASSMATSISDFKKRDEIKKSTTCSALISYMASSLVLTQIFFFYILGSRKRQLPAAPPLLASGVWGGSADFTAGHDRRSHKLIFSTINQRRL